jgi:hypothetical protein
MIVLIALQPATSGKPPSMLSSPVCRQLETLGQHALPGMYESAHSCYAAPEYFGPDYLKRLILVYWVRLFFSQTCPTASLKFALTRSG